MSNVDKIISFNITEFPQNLLIPGIENKLKIQAINISNKNENFKFDFEGENLKIDVSPAEFKNIIEFDPGETKNIELKLEPTADGHGKLNINVNWLKITEIKVKTQKIREIVSDSKTKKILQKQAFQITEKIEIFNSAEYFIDMTQDIIKKAEQQLQTLRGEFNSAQTMGSPTSELVEKIDAYIKQIAKGYLSTNNPLKALEYALMLSNNSEQMDLYTNLIRAYASKDFNQMVQLATNLYDLELQQNILKFLAFDQVLINPEQAIRTAILIQNSSLKEDLLINIFNRIIESNPTLALSFSQLIDNEFLKARSLFNIAKKLYDQNSKSELVNIFHSIVQLMLGAYGNNLDSRKAKKKSYGLIMNAIHMIAEIENPTMANSIIERITIQDLKEKLMKDLFDVIYVMVDEIQTKVEATPVFSQYFLLNIYFSKINNEITNFSLIGGNISNNVLLNDFNFTIVFLSLFGFDFSVFPILDRVYNDIKYTLKKSFAYFVFPSKQNYNENELKTLKVTLNQFFKNLSSSRGQILIVNLDFVPYLGKPTVIISDKSESSKKIYSKIKKIGDTINLITDDSVFKSGAISDELGQIFPGNKSRIINLVLSYEFINDYNIFKTFIQTLL
ncbi:MAG: hypothetical protein ACFE9N_09405 [Promethearchaeota archaeon]